MVSAAVVRERVARPTSVPQEAPFQVIDRLELQGLIKEEGIDNTRAAAGVALVNVLRYKLFTEGRIPGSINIPLGREDEFDHRFHKDKMIVLYSGSEACEISQSVARALTLRGFRRVFDYAGGLANWRATGGMVMSGHV